MSGHEVNLRSLLVPGKRLSQDNLVAAVEWALKRIAELEAERIGSQSELLSKRACRESVPLSFDPDDYPL